MVESAHRNDKFGLEFQCVVGSSKLVFCDDMFSYWMCLLFGISFVVEPLSGAGHSNHYERAKLKVLKFS